MQNRETLQTLVIKAVQENPQGMSHVELVRYVLETGYHHPGNLSADLMLIVRFLCKKCIIQKNLETREIKKIKKIGRNSDSHLAVV